MTQPRVQQLHQSGAIPGHGLVFDGTVWTPRRLTEPIDAIESFDSQFAGTDLGYDVEFDREETTTLPTGWSATNMSGGYYENGGLGALYAPSTGGSTDPQETHRLITRALPTESTWVCVAKLPSLQTAPNGDFFRGALVLRDSAGGDYLTWGRRVTNDPGSLNTVSLDYFSALNAAPSNQDAAYFPDVQKYLLIYRDSATDYGFACSADGINFWYFWTGLDPTSFGLSLDQIGVLVGCRDSRDALLSIDWFRVR